MHVFEILLSKEQKDRGLSREDKITVDLLKKKIDQYIDALAKPDTTPSHRASLHQRMASAVAEVKKITESLNSQADYQIEHDDDRLFVATFWIDEIQYAYRAIKNPTHGWIIEFIDNTASDEEMFSLTGRGNSSYVMGTVVNLTRHFLHEHPEVDKLSFMAKEPSRESLYKRIVGKLMPNWNINQKGAIITVSKKSSKMMEAVYKVPLTEEDFDNIKKLLEKPIPAALSMIYLQEVIVDDELNDVLISLEDAEPNRDIRPFISEWIKRVMPDQLWRFGIGEQTDRQKLGNMSPISGYDPHTYKSSSGIVTGNVVK